MPKLSRAQREALKRVYDRTTVISKTAAGSSASYLAFRRTIQQGYGCVMVFWCGMWLGIEPDGYTHS
jgi:hypothetical protein